MPGPLVPEDDLYATLEVGMDASPEAIELAWRALLKRHHPDVAGDGPLALERAKRINVAHDWLSDPGLRSRYDRTRPRDLSPAASARRTGVRYGRSAREAPTGAGESARPARSPRRATARPDLVRGDPARRLAAFLERVARLRPDELDRLAVAAPPPIAFLATVRRFIGPDAHLALGAAESSLASLVAPDRWAEPGVREALLAVVAELVLAGFLDENLAEPFRGRARERLLRAWDASIDQPRHGPNAVEVAALRDRVAVLDRAELASFLRASAGIPGGDRPWPRSLDRDEDEALRISASLAARDVAAALPDLGISPAVATRARRLLGRLGHVVALRHAYPPSTYAGLVAPWREATRTAAADGMRPPGVRRAG